MATTPKKSSKRKTPQMKLSFSLDDAKIKQIQRCLKKGRLTITVTSIGKIGQNGGTNGYIYD